MKAETAKNTAYVFQAIHQTVTGSNLGKRTPSDLVPNQILIHTFRSSRKQFQNGYTKHTTPIVRKRKTAGGQFQQKQNQNKNLQQKHSPRRKQNTHVIGERAQGSGCSVSPHLRPSWILDECGRRLPSQGFLYTSALEGRIPHSAWRKTQSQATARSDEKIIRTPVSE
jgi:hypothetical protein